MNKIEVIKNMKHSPGSENNIETYKQSVTSFKVDTEKKDIKKPIESNDDSYDQVCKTISKFTSGYLKPDWNKLPQYFDRFIPLHKHEKRKYKEKLSDYSTQYFEGYFPYLLKSTVEIDYYEMLDYYLTKTSSGRKRLFDALDKMMDADMRSELPS